MITKLSGTFSVVSVNKPTKRKGFDQLKEHDVFKIEMPVNKTFSKKVDLDVIINGVRFSYTLNEISLFFRTVITVEQIN